jgi:hypothetical protein
MWPQASENPTGQEHSAFVTFGWLSFL